MERYLWVLGGLALSGVILTGNVLAAIALTPQGGWPQAIFVVLSLTCDILVIAAMKSIRRALISNEMTNVILAGLAWAVMASCVCYSCSEWFREVFSQSDSKQIMALTDMRSLDDKLIREREHLGAAEQTALSATTQMKREDAKKEAAATRTRIQDLESKRQWPAQVVSAGSVNQIIHGRELPMTLVFFGLSQVCWFFGLTTGEPTPKPETTKKTNEEPSRRPRSSPAQTSPKTNVVSLVPDQVLSMVRDGFSEREIATRAGIPRSQVRTIKRRMQLIAGK